MAGKAAQGLSLSDGLLSSPPALTAFWLHWPSYQHPTSPLPHLTPTPPPPRALESLKLFAHIASSAKGPLSQLFPEPISSRNLD